MGHLPDTVVHDGSVSAVFAETSVFTLGLVKKEVTEALHLNIISLFQQFQSRINRSWIAFPIWKDFGMTA